MKIENREHTNCSISQFLNSSANHKFLEKLNTGAAFCVLATGAFFYRAMKMPGLEQHFVFNRLLDSGVKTESDLRSWLYACFPAVNTMQWDNCRKQADELLKNGVEVFKWKTLGNPKLPADRGSGDSIRLPMKDIACPSVLFGKGSAHTSLPLVAVFNSRKPRLVSPDADWLNALRFFFRCLEPEKIALAGSTGTLTYDLSGVLAQRSGFSQILVAPFALQDAERELSKIYGEGASGLSSLSCILYPGSCPKKKRVVCRDNILAAFANFHLVIEIRSGGNLAAVLDGIQRQSPRHEFIFEPRDFSSLNAGNRTLFSNFPEHTHGFKLPVFSEGSARPGRIRHISQHGKSVCGEEAVISFDDYLYHYTRACAGPWPGQTYREYLLNMLNQIPLSRHSALETLIRILQESTIRGSSRMIRGETAVISWSAHSPRDLSLMKKWNRALARWTVEPYGIAVRRDVLRSLGAKPAIYGEEQTYSRIPQSERYRFQLSRSNASASWRHEREWRIRGDLMLDRIKFDQGFIFLRSEEEKSRLYDCTQPELPIIVFNS